MRIYELLIELPFLRKGAIFYFSYDDGLIHGEENGEPMKYPLRTGLASYLWLLLTENEKYLKEVGK